MPLLFSYGSLQNEEVQLSTYGRRLKGEADELRGYKLSKFGENANVVFSGNEADGVRGVVFEVSDAELSCTDTYEAQFFYERVAAALRSEREAWLYLHR